MAKLQHRTPLYSRHHKPHGIHQAVVDHGARYVPLAVNISTGISEVSRILESTDSPSFHLAFFVSTANTYSIINSPKYIIAPAMLPFAGSFVTSRISMTDKVFSIHAH